MDFAETEVDERRINLTRFPLFFPEKRMFFLEGSEVFSFSSSVSFMPFFSRRIGLFEGTQIPVRFGTKLYGKIGNTNLAVLDVQTRRYGARADRPPRPQPPGRAGDPEHLRPEQGRLDLHQRQSDGREEFAGRRRLQLFVLEVPRRQEHHARGLGRLQLERDGRRDATTASASGPTIRTTSGTSRRPTPTTARRSTPAWDT